MARALTVASMSNSGRVKCEEDDDGQGDHEKSGRRGPSATHGELLLLHGECFFVNKTTPKNQASRKENEERRGAKMYL